MGRIKTGVRTRLTIHLKLGEKLLFLALLNNLDTLRLLIRVLDHLAQQRQPTRLGRISLFVASLYFWLMKTSYSEIVQYRMF